MARCLKYPSDSSSQTIVARLDGIANLKQIKMNLTLSNNKMRNLLIGLLLIIITKFYSQRVDRFQDSLTLNKQRTWHRTDGARFTKLKDDCSYGMELTFYKDDNKVTFRKCDKGEWTQNDYHFRVTTKDENHYVEIFEGSNIISTIEIQMLGKNNVFRTELTYFNIHGREYYTLISDEK